MEENITNICVRYDALRVFIELYQAILETMLDIYKDKTWNSESITTANGLYNYMINRCTQCMVPYMTRVINCM